MEIFLGYFLYAMSLLTVGGIYALLALGLNVQWGFAGLFNAGVAGFAMVLYLCFINYCKKSISFWRFRIAISCW